jgi:dihydrofolate synthase/folylpolyglutamate synthase
MPVGLSDWLSYLEQLHPKSIALGLERVGQVWDRLAIRPKFPVITVAGTNGKGSACAMLERVYLEAGYRVACYTSPHLLRYNERVRVHGQEAVDAQLCRAFTAVEQVRQDTPLTYFEFGTLAAMWHFIQEQVDVAILEVGLGGRLDAVNIFDPACAVLTSVDLDHVDYLGNSRESIGREKAGIFRAGIPAVCGDADAPASVLEYARTIHADFRKIGDDFGFIRHQAAWEFNSGDMHFPELPLPALSGSFQLHNAACVLEVVRVLQSKLPVPKAAICDGLQHVALAGRFQVFSGKPSVILDVAHNPHAARGLAENLRKLPHAGRTLAVFAMLADKDIHGVVRALVGEVDVWYVADTHHPRGATGLSLVDILREIAPAAAIESLPDVLSAYRQACLSAGENDRIAAFGSFYTVADVLRELPVPSAS